MVRFVSPLPLFVAVSAFVAQSVDADQVQGEPLYAKLANVSVQSQLRGKKDAKADGLWQAMRAEDLDHLDAHQTIEDGQRSIDGAGEDGSQEVTCSCTNPNAGTGGGWFNEYTCTDGTKAYCSNDQACYATVPFVKGDWLAGCQVTCSCTTPNAETTGHNHYTCTDGDTGSCSSDQTCYAIGPFVKGDWQKGCQVPTPTPPYECVKTCAKYRGDIFIGYDGTHWCGDTATNPIPRGQVWVDPQIQPHTNHGCCSLAASSCAYCCKPRDRTCVLASLTDRCKGTSTNNIPEGEQWLAMYTEDVGNFFEHVHGMASVCCSK